MTRPNFDEIMDYQRNAHGALITRRGLVRVGCGACVGAIVALVILALGSVSTDRPASCAGYSPQECVAVQQGLF